MILLIDTSSEQIGKSIYDEIAEKRKLESEYICTSDLNISHCVGCNFCWLKTI